MLDPARLEALAAELLAVAGELRAERDSDNLVEIVSCLNPPNSAEIDADGWMTEAEIAALLGCRVERLRAHRRDGTGPEFQRYGRNGRFVRYRRSAALAWAERNPGRNSGLSEIDDANG